MFLDVSGWFIADGTGLWTPSGKFREDKKIYIFLNVARRVELGKGHSVFVVLYFVPKIVANHNRKTKKGGNGNQSYEKTISNTKTQRNKKKRRKEC